MKLSKEQVENGAVKLTRTEKTTPIVARANIEVALLMNHKQDMYGETAQTGSVSVHFVIYTILHVHVYIPIISYL